MTVDSATAALDPPPTEENREPDTVAELAEVPLRPGHAAVHVWKPEWYFVVRHREESAGAIAAPAGGTVAEWAECDPTAEVVEAVPERRIRRSIARVRTPEDLLQAVADGTVRPVAVPERRLYRSLEEFAEARDRGEWGGLLAYVRGER